MNDRAASASASQNRLRLYVSAEGSADPGLREKFLLSPRPSLASRTAWNVVASAVASGGRLLASLILARLLDPAEMGRFALASWVVEMVVLGVSFGVPNALTRHLAESRGRNALPGRAVTASGVTAWLLTATVIGGGTAFGLGALWVFRGFNWPISAALGLLLCCQLWSGVAQAVLIGLERFKPLAAVNLGGTLCSLLALGLGSALWGLRGAVGGATLGFAVSGTLALSRARDVWCPVAWRQTGMPVPNRAFWQYALNAWGAALISAVVWGRTELLFLERFAGYVQAAYFGIGLAFSSLTVQLLQLFTGALMPHFAWCVGRGDSKTLNRDYRWLTVLAASIAFPVAALAVGLMPDLLPLTFGSAYSEAVPAGMWLAACGLWGFATVGSAAVYGLGDAALIRRWSVAGAVLMAVGCWGLVPLYGAAGAAVVRFGVQGIMVIAGTLILRFRYGLPFPAVQLGKLLLAATAAGMAAQMVDAAIGGGWAGVAAGLAAGGTTYLLCVRGLRAIDRGIADGLRAVASGMVGPVGRTLAAAVRLVAGGT